MRVNGLTLVEATHEEVVNLIKLRKTLTLTLKSKPRFSLVEKSTANTNVLWAMSVIKVDTVTYMRALFVFPCQAVLHVIWHCT